MPRRPSVSKSFGPSAPRVHRITAPRVSADPHRPRTDHPRIRIGDGPKIHPRPPRSVDLTPQPHRITVSAMRRREF